MKKIWKIFFLILFIAGVIDISRYFFYPLVDDLKLKNPLPTAFMEYREAQWKENNENKTIHQKWVKMKNISPNVVKAVLIGEDDGFWNHDGFDVAGMEAALERSINKGTLAGGSTISQQLAKNIYLSPSKNPVRKIKEAILTWRIEHSLSKRRILEIYLNVAEWGDGIFGIEAAAHHYYGKKASALTALEASHLAAVLPNPIKFNPKSNQKYVKNRSKIIYKIMKRRGIHIQQFKEVMQIPVLDENLLPKDIEENIQTLFNPGETEVKATDKEITEDKSGVSQNLQPVPDGSTSTGH